jgi:hypothetical protein
VRNANTNRSDNRLHGAPGKACKEKQWDCDQSKKEAADESEKLTF